MQEMENFGTPNSQRNTKIGGFQNGEPRDAGIRISHEFQSPKNNEIRDAGPTNSHRRTETYAEENSAGAQDRRFRAPKTLPTEGIERPRRQRADVAIPREMIIGRKLYGDDGTALRIATRDLGHAIAGFRQRPRLAATISNGRPNRCRD